VRLQEEWIELEAINYLCAHGVVHGRAHSGEF